MGHAEKKVKNMRKLIFILLAALFLAGNCYGMDRYWYGLYENNQYGRDARNGSNCKFSINERNESHDGDNVLFSCKNPNKFDFSFGVLPVKQVDNSSLNILSGNKIVGKIVRNDNKTLSISPNLIMMDALMHKEGFIICNGKDNYKERICKRGTRNQLDGLSKFFSRMEFAKVR